MRHAHKAVKRIVTAALSGEQSPPRRVRERNYDAVADLVREKVEKVEKTERLLPAAAGYAGSAHNFYRLVAAEKRREPPGSGGGGDPADG